MGILARRRFEVSRACQEGSLLRIVFFGSSSYAVPSLRALAAEGCAPVGVVTHPERSRRRGRAPDPGQVRLVAEELGLSCLLEADVNRPGFHEWLLSMQADLALVISFGQIFRRPLLELPRLGCFNAHGSLLPRFRGAAPIQWALLMGEETTGVTIIRMTPGMDRGPVLLRSPLAIESREDSISLRRRLAELSATAFLETVRVLARGPILLEPQDESGATYAPKLLSSDGRLDWGSGAAELDRRVRALLDAPGAFTHWQGRPLQIREGRPERQEGPSGPPGTVLAAGEQGLLVATRDGAYRITALKPAGSREMTAAAFLRGTRLKVGDVLS